MEEGDKKCCYNYIHDKLYLNSKKNNDIGLFEGKMGICIYFYFLSRFYDIQKYSDYADELIEDIYGSISSVGISFETGLIGIGWGIEYLVRYKYLDADGDILGDIDVKLLKYLENGELGSRNNLSELCWCLKYIKIRLESSNVNDSSSHYRICVLKELLYSLVNKIGGIASNTINSLKNDYVFDLLLELPLVINTLRQIKSLNLFVNKIDLIFDSLINYLKTIEPSLNVNKLNVISSLFRFIKDGGKSEYLGLVVKMLDNVDFEVLINELDFIQPKSLRFGGFSINIILNNILNSLSSITFIDNEIVEKVKDQIILINKLKNNNEFEFKNERVGLMNGYQGVFLFTNLDFDNFIYELII